MVPALKNEDYEEEKIEQWSMTDNPTQRSWKDKYKFAEHSFTQQKVSALIIPACYQ